MDLLDSQVGLSHGAEHRLRHRLIVSSVLVASAVVGGTGCGDDEPPRRQAAFWLGLATSATATCRYADTFQLPDLARTTITSQTGRGCADGEECEDRIVDTGDYVIDCSVTPSASAAGSFDVNLNLSGGRIGVFNANGVLSPAGGELDVSLQTTAFTLEQDGCTAMVDTVIPGAVWIRALACPQMVEERTPGNSCSGNGGLIFENCGR
jgi:hypothetical protein